MAAASGPTPRSVRPVYLLLGVALLVGVVACLLIAAAPAPPPIRSSQLFIELPASVWGLLFLSPLLVGVVALLYRRLTEPASPVATRTLVLFAVMFVLCVVFVFAFAAGGFGGGGFVTFGEGHGPGGNNSTSPVKNNTTSPPQNNSSSTGSVYPQGLTVARLSSADLAWILIGITIIAAVLAVPGVLAMLLDHRPRPSAGGPPASRARVQAALAEARTEIAMGGDPRETVVRLYVRLLEAITPKTGDISCLTADEIRVQALAALGVRPVASEALTRLFEEARYSTHPFGPSEAARFRGALKDAESDLLKGLAS